MLSRDKILPNAAEALSPPTSNSMYIMVFAGLGSANPIAVLWSIPRARVTFVGKLSSRSAQGLRAGPDERKTLRPLTEPQENSSPTLT